MLKTILKMTTSVLVAALLCGGTFVVGTLFQMNQNMTASYSAQALMGLSDADESAEPEVPDTLPDDFYVLLLGVDSDENRTEGEEAQYFNGAFRSDTIILAHVTLSTKKITLCSFERDIRTVIDGYEADGYYKLNAAYLLGDVYLMRDEIEDMTGVDIPYYAVVDMGGLTEIIDAAGGVDVDVEDSFWDEQLQAGLDQAGMQHLNGADAVMYCRSRYAWAEGDFARARHQRQVLQALANKLMQGDLWTLYNAANELSTHIGTNFTVSQIFEVAGKLQGMDASNDIYSMMTPTTGWQDDDGTSYQILNETAWEVMLEQLKANDDPAETAEQLEALGAGSSIDYEPAVEETATDDDKNSNGMSDVEVAEQAIADGTAVNAT